MPLRASRFLLPGLLALAVLLPACRVTLPIAGRPLAAGGEAASTLAGGPAPDLPGVQAGAYAEDERWAPFVRSWMERVDAAFERLEVTTGLAFAASTRPRVVLRPFGNERRTHEMRIEVMEGRRRIILHVNIEPLLAGSRDADRVLVRGLAEAAFQDASRRHGPVPAWVIHMAGSAAAGDLDRRLAAVRRALASGDSRAARVDPEDATAAEATGLAALALLAERGEPGAVRRTLLFIADGDEAGGVLGRLVRRPGGGWAEEGSLALRTRLAQIDAEPWRVLARLEAAGQETGRAGLEAAVPEDLPVEIADDVLLLRARYAADEGDYAAARAHLRGLSAQASARLQDPAAALALQMRLESRAGGDARLARHAAERLDRDYPASEARMALRRAHPLLGMQEDPQRWLVTMRERLASEGTAGLDLRTLERYARMLLLDHRAGAAQHFLADLGERRHAPELAAVGSTVAEAQAAPTDAARARSAERVEVWRALRTADAARDVCDGGSAARPALLALLADPDRELRAQALTLLAAAVGEVQAVASVRGLWSADAERVPSDLEALASAVSYEALESVLDPRGVGEAASTRVTAGWESLTFGLSRLWLHRHPDFLQAVRSSAFAVRRAAFERIGREAPDEITPALVAHGLRDSAALLRREAMVLAGAAEFSALARRGLLDHAWVVREEAVRAVSRIDSRAAVGVLAGIVRHDASREVRAAAALALIRHAPEDDRALDALLGTQVAEESRLRDAIAARLAELEAGPVVRAIVRGWRRALGRPSVNRGYLFRSALLFERLSRERLGYYPGATRPEIESMTARMEAWLEGRSREAGAGEGVRRPVGRGR